MGRRLQVYLPTWVRWMLTPMFLIIWGIISYATFFTPAGQQGPGLLVWGAITVMLFLIGAMIWLMSAGQLPAYIIEEPDDEG